MITDGSHRWIVKVRTPDGTVEDWVGMKEECVKCAKAGTALISELVVRCDNNCGEAFTGTEAAKILQELMMRTHGSHIGKMPARLKEIFLEKRFGWLIRDYVKE